MNSPLKILDILTRLCEYCGYWWQYPLMNKNEYGDTIYEWWYQGRKLTMYINDKETLYIKVWGGDVNNDMVNGLIKNENDLETLWKWLT